MKTHSQGKWPSHTHDTWKHSQGKWPSHARSTWKHTHRVSSHHTHTHTVSTHTRFVIVLFRLSVTTVFSSSPKSHKSSPHSQIRDRKCKPPKLNHKVKDLDHYSAGWVMNRTSMWSGAVLIIWIYILSSVDVHPYPCIYQCWTGWNSSLPFKAL